MIVPDKTTLKTFRAEGERVWRVRNPMQAGIVRRMQDYGKAVEIWNVRGLTDPELQANVDAKLRCFAQTAACLARLAFEELTEDEKGDEDAAE